MQRRNRVTVAGLALLGPVVLISLGVLTGLVASTSYQTPEIPTTSADPLAGAVLQPDDLPAQFARESSSGSASLDEEVNAASQGQPFLSQDRFRSSLESYGFLRAFRAFYRANAESQVEGGLLFVGSQVWLLSNEEGAQSAFIESVRTTNESPIPQADAVDGFSPMGDASEAFFSYGPSTDQGRLEGYLVYIRVGRLVGFLGTTSTPGDADEQEAIDIARSFVSRMEVYEPELKAIVD